MATGKKQPQLPATHTTPTTTAETAKSGRKAWVRRTPTDVVIDQIKKQEQRVAPFRKSSPKKNEDSKNWKLPVSCSNQLSSLYLGVCPRKLLFVGGR